MMIGENFGELWGDAYFPREEQKVLGARNLLDVVSSVHTANGTTSGVTIATNSDGTVTFSTATTAQANVDYIIGSSADGRLKLSDYPSNIILSKGSSVSSQNLLMQVWYYDSSKNYTGFQNESGSGEGEFLLQPQSGDVYFAINFRVINGKSVNTTIKPMLRLASDSDSSFTRYTMTNRKITDFLAEDRNITSECTVVSGITYNASWTSIRKTGKNIYGTVRFTTPSTLSSDVGVILMPAKYYPLTRIVAPLTQVWDGAVIGMMIISNATANGGNIILASNSWQTGKEGIFSFCYAI